jgi:hypothetical protein
MLVKAKNSFTCTTINMAVGEVREITDQEILSDLLNAGYVEEVKHTTMEGGAKVESKRTNSSKRSRVS